MNTHQTSRFGALVLASAMLTACQMWEYEPNDVKQPMSTEIAVCDLLSAAPGHGNFVDGVIEITITSSELSPGALQYLTQTPELDLDEGVEVSAAEIAAIVGAEGDYEPVTLTTGIRVAASDDYTVPKACIYILFVDENGNITMIWRICD